MNDTELFELCKEVYERTGLETDELLSHRDLVRVPLYTSDYLLEKLHSVVMLDERYIGIVATHDEFAAQLTLCDEEGIEKEIKNYHGKTPLIALLKLVIALDDAGVKL